MLPAYTFDKCSNIKQTICVTGHDGSLENAERKANKDQGFSQLSDPIPNPKV